MLDNNDIPSPYDHDKFNERAIKFQESVWRKFYTRAYGTIAASKEREEVILSLGKELTIKWLNDEPWEDF